MNYAYRYNNEASANKFGEWLAHKDWTELYKLETSDEQAESYQADMNWAIENFFPLRTIKRRNIDPPWINGHVKKMIKTPKKIWRDNEGRTEEWKKMKDRTDELIDKRIKVYQASQKLALLADDADRNFYKNTKNYISHQRPKPFDVMDLFPGREEDFVCEHLADHFNKISNEFLPLAEDEIPRTFSAPLPLLEPYQVAGRLRAFKKTKSMVRGDIFPDLVTRFADLLALPLTSIYNKITSTSRWPKIWKEEHVTVIPKTKNPTDISGLRNISCTKLSSKVYESYVLEWMGKWVSLKENQYGGPRVAAPATW